MLGLLASFNCDTEVDELVRLGRRLGGDFGKGRTPSGKPRLLGKDSRYSARVEVGEVAFEDRRLSLPWECIVQ